MFPGEIGSRDGRFRAVPAIQEAQYGADLRPLRFHDLRHTFGTQAIAGGPTSLQQVDGPRHLPTTMRYVHYRDRGREAELLAEAFQVEPDVPSPDGAKR